jgi:hypothetical protein
MALKLIQNLFKQLGIGIVRNETLKELLKSYDYLQQLNARIGDASLLCAAPEKYSGKILQYWKDSKSQFRQDLFVLSQTDFKQDGFLLNSGRLMVLI